MKTSQRLRQDVLTLSSEIGERNLRHYSRLLEAASFLRDRFRALNYEVESHDYEVDGEFYSNLSVERRSPGDSHQMVIVGAHYDSFVGSPGANDNASGIALLLELAARLRQAELPYNLRFVAFVNEEPPFFRSAQMGSYMYAKQLADRMERVTGMMCLDTVGYFDTEPETQRQTFGSMPTTADFIAVVGPGRASGLIESCLALLGEHRPALPVFGFTDFSEEVNYVNYSDHWPFNAFGWPALMVTDTGPMRSSHYHTSEDTADKMNFDRMAELADALEFVLLNLGPKLPAI